MYRVAKKTKQWIFLNGTGASLSLQRLIGLPDCK